MRHLILVLSCLLVSCIGFAQGYTPFANPGVKPNWYAVTPNGLRADSTVWFPKYRELTPGDTALIAFDSEGKGYPIYKSTIKSWISAQTKYELVSLTYDGSSSKQYVIPDEFIASTVLAYVNGVLQLHSISGSTVTITTFFNQQVTDKITIIYQKTN